MSFRILERVFRIICHEGVLPQDDLGHGLSCVAVTQRVAIERAGRRCFTVGLDPVDCDVAVRWRD